VIWLFSLCAFLGALLGPQGPYQDARRLPRYPADTSAPGRKENPMEHHQSPTDADADAINDVMVRRMEERRAARQERRNTDARPTRPGSERRQTCSYCYQRGDHRNAADCRRALERSPQ
jgi:hypothetical protein